ncbi:MAG: hypothetical protein GX754_10615 [Clostridiaceae bacterium]|nr:hypothetical protein [Clostridiaceae bacterium]
MRGNSYHYIDNYVGSGWNWVFVGRKVEDKLGTGWHGPRHGAKVWLG